MKQRLMLLFLSCAILLDIILCNYFLSNGFGIEGATISVFFGLLFYKVSNTISSLKYMEKSNNYIIVILLISFIYPFLISISCLMLYYYIQNIYIHVIIGILPVLSSLLLFYSIKIKFSLFSSNDKLI